MKVRKNVVATGFKFLTSDVTEGFKFFLVNEEEGTSTTVAAINEYDNGLKARISVDGKTVNFSDRDVELNRPDVDSALLFAKVNYGMARLLIELRSAIQLASVAGYNITNEAELYSSAVEKHLAYYQETTDSLPSNYAALLAA